MAEEDGVERGEEELATDEVHSGGGGEEGYMIPQVPDAQYQIWYLWDSCRSRYQALMPMGAMRKREKRRGKHKNKMAIFLGGGRTLFLLVAILDSDRRCYILDTHVTMMVMDIACDSRTDTSISPPSSNSLKLFLST
uniref:Uncharacterized protein n=1 Tax=Oryza sativa subsp. japonica TaxID=39947 RepID=Q6Z2W7_ORYSJ|nr:hypothetical protein [Oryza sativa Japonica Group]